MRVRPAAIIMATATLGGLAGILTTFSVGCRSTGSKAPAWLQSAPLDCSMALSGQLGWLLENREFQSAMQTAGAVGAGAEAVASVVSKLVNKWLRQVVG